MKVRNKTHCVDLREMPTHLWKQIGGCVGLGGLGDGMPINGYGFLFGVIKMF